MATRQEIVDIIDNLLEGEIAPEKAISWAKKEIPKTNECDDPPSALITIMLGLNPDPQTRMSGDWEEELRLDRDVLIRGVPCPGKDLGKKVEAYWMAYTPEKKVVLCQIKKIEDGKRVFELKEESWEREQTFYEQIPVPIQGEEPPFLSKKDIKEKLNKYKTGKVTRKEILQWIIDQLQKKTAVSTYEDLMELYWKLRRPDEYFTHYYYDYSTKASRKYP